MRCAEPQGFLLWRRAASAAAGAAIALLAGIAAQAPSASAHFTRSVFTYKEDSCSGKRIDPLNVFFYTMLGGASTPSNSAAHLEEHLGWGGTTPGVSQAIRSGGRCNNEEDERHLGFRDKHHIRFFPMTDDGHGYVVTFGDAHRERKKICGRYGRYRPADAVYKRYRGRSGFDYGQREVVRGMRNGGHRTLFSRRYPHRARFKQCTGERVAWNGRVYGIRINDGDP